MLVGLPGLDPPAKKITLKTGNSLRGAMLRKDFAGNTKQRTVKALILRRTRARIFDAQLNIN